MPLSEPEIEVELDEGTPDSLGASLTAAGVKVRRRGTMHSLDPIGGTVLFLFLAARSLGEWLGVLAKAPEIVSLYLSNPVGAVIGGAVAGKLVEKVMDVALKWAREWAGEKNHRVNIVLYGPDGRTLTERSVDPRADTLASLAQLKNAKARAQVTCGYCTGRGQVIAGIDRGLPTWRMCVPCLGTGRLPDASEQGKGRP